MNTFGLKHKVESFWLGSLGGVVEVIYGLKAFSLTLIRNVNTQIIVYTKKSFDMER